MSVNAIKVVTADGELVTASPKENPELFYGAIGGYGGLGVITEATLSLADNVNVERRVERMPLADYKKYFDDHIRDDKNVIFHNGDFYPPDYGTVTAVTYTKTDKPVTVPDRLRPRKESYLAEFLGIFSMTQIPGVNKLRPKVDEKLRFKGDEVVPRNYEASRYVEELEPSTRAFTTYVLQEYFVPADQLDAFAPKMAEILKKHHVNALNVSIRHAEKDPGSVMAWAQQGEVFAFVLYHKQWNNETARQEVGAWTRELIDAATDCGGTYYLPYQMHATEAQFKKAYPRAEEFFALKRKCDPENKFRNRLWDKYYDGGPKIDPETPAFRNSHRLMGRLKEKFAKAIAGKSASPKNPFRKNPGGPAAG
jgi:FAD/FMN-containing dehydrogenase